MNAALRTAVALALTLGCQPSPRTSDGPVRTPAHLIKTAGDGQTGINGSGAPITPSVRVTDEAGNPVSGVPVVWSAIGGATRDAQSVTSNDGAANCGYWVLGGGTLTQLQASVEGLDPVVFSATSLNVAPTFEISLLSPMGALTGDKITVTAKITDPHRLVSVTAHVNGASAGMTPISTGTESVFSIEFIGPLPFQIGQLIPVMVHAQDDQGAESEAAEILVFDSPPDLVVSSPTELLSLTRPQLQLSAAATVSNGDVTLTASSHGVMLAQGTNILLASVDLSAFDNQIDAIDFTATDRLGGSTTVTRSVWVSSNQNLQPMASVSGQLRDFDGQRALHANDGGLLIAEEGADTVIGPDVSPVGLSPLGAVSCTLLPFDQGKVTTQGALSFVPRDCGLFDVEGRYLFYTDTNNLPFLADLDLDLVVSVSSAALTSQLSLAPTGDAVFSDTTGQIIHATLDGGSMPLPLDTSDGTYRIGPSTDGRLTVYGLCNSMSCPSIGIWDGTREVRFTPDVEPTAVWVNNGWLVWTNEAAELWEARWPATGRQLGAKLTPIALLPSGTVVALGNGQLWRIAPEGVPEPLLAVPHDRPLPRVIQRNGHAYLLFEGVAVEVL